MVLDYGIARMIKAEMHALQSSVAEKKRAQEFEEKTIQELRQKMVDVLDNQSLIDFFLYLVKVPSLTLAYSKDDEVLALEGSGNNTKVPLKFTYSRKGRELDVAKIVHPELGFILVSEFYNTFKIHTLPCKSLVIYPEEINKPVEINPYTTDCVTAAILEDLVNRSVATALDKPYNSLCPELLLSR